MNADVSKKFVRLTLQIDNKFTKLTIENFNQLTNDVNKRINIVIN